MKTRVVSTGLAVACALLMASRAGAVEDSLKWGMCEKGSRGLVNIFTCWMEVPMQVYKGYQEGTEGIDAPSASRTIGAFRGLWRGVTHTGGRATTGAFELGGFWTRNPTTNEHTLQLQDATYAWQIGTKKPFKCPTSVDGMRRVGYRMERGLRGTIFGVTEIPGQMRKADAERRHLLGIPKGIWMASSRIVEGANDLVSVPLAAPEAPLNVPFDEVEPWDAFRERYYNNVK